MREKTKKSPIVVIAAMMFLLMFIVLPPLLRAYIPKPEDPYKVTIKKSTLYCERVLIAEKKMISSTISYENDAAVKNVMHYMDYTPMDGEKDDEKYSFYSAWSEINYLKSISGVDIDENASQTIITLTDDNLVGQNVDPNLFYYLSSTDAATKYFKERGFECKKQN